MKTRSSLFFAMNSVASRTRWIGAGAVLALAAGCATGPNANPADPLEPFNRGVSRFNDAVDDAVLVPAATAYQNALPSMVRTGVNNFFNNIGDVWNLVNNVAQLKLQNSAETFMRLNVNTIFGLGGVLDVATEARLPRHEEDFGQTLGYWGVGSGPYVVLPLLGSSTLRDTAAKPLDMWGDPLGYVEDIPWRNSLTVLRVVDTRSQYLRASRLLGDAALDKYSFTRDAYLQRRRSQVYDGNPPDDGGGMDKGADK
ncbi:VacJ family lipoprotein [Variovorax guangxiensis]|uniref:VacJ family lipoprotein n=2 Tax=Comamonadaceae TaxID=80864 RepID=A0A433MLZ2_9BURK|nr:VacJ family lipoprotein [Variovorax guangxiensis]